MTKRDSFILEEKSHVYKKESPFLKKATLNPKLFCKGK